MTMAQTVTDPLLLESCVRDELNVTAPRYVKTIVSSSIYKTLSLNIIRKI